MFKEFNGKFNQQKIEQEILKFWDTHQIFKKSIETRDKNKQFIFYEGPPTANGAPASIMLLAARLKILYVGIKQCMAIVSSEKLDGIHMAYQWKSK